MDKQLCKVWYAIISSKVLFGSLPLVILMGDFSQFAPGTGHALWDLLYCEDEIYMKVLWDNFWSVLSLIEQMRQRSDLAFQAILKRTKHSLLNLKDINYLNTRVATYLPNFNFANTIIIVQKIRQDTWSIACRLKILPFFTTWTLFSFLLSIPGIKKMEVTLFNTRTSSVCKKVKETLQALGYSTTTKGCIPWYYPTNTYR